MKPSRPNKILVLLNIVFFLGVVIVNSLANIVKFGGRQTGEISDSIPNLFVPSGITFAVWGAIYLLLLGFAVYQGRGLFGSNERLGGRIKSIGVFFIASCALNMAWIFAWHYLLVGLSLLIMIALLASLIILYLRLNRSGPKLTLPEYFFLRLPFSVYLGWISVATIANVTAILVTAGWDGFGASQAFWTVFMIGIALALALAVLFIRRDSAYALVFVWAFLGIYLKRVQSGGTFVPEVAYAAFIAMAVTVAAIIVNVVRLAARNAKSKPVLP